MKEGDYGTKLVFTILDENNSPLDLTEATEVRIKAKMNDEIIIDKECAIEGLHTEGIVSYTTQPGDISSHGRILMEIEITFGSLKKFTTSTIKEIIVDKI